MKQVFIEDLYIRDSKEKWIVGGQAIPYDTPTQVKDLDPTSGAVITYVEEFAPNSIMIPANGVILKDEHLQEIGVLTRSESTDKGWKVELEIDKTPTGAAVRQELKTGKKVAFSIGFAKEPLETIYDKTREVYRRTKALVKEISVTANPQYINAGIEYVRSNPIEEKIIMPEENKKEENTEPKAPVENPPKDVLTRSTLDNAIRDLRGELNTSLLERSMPSKDFRSPGEFAQALAKGDKSTITKYENLLKRSNSELVAAADNLKTRAFPVLRLDSFIFSVIALNIPFGTNKKFSSSLHECM